MKMDRREVLLRAQIVLAASALAACSRPQTGVASGSLSPISKVSQPPSPMPDPTQDPAQWKEAQSEPLSFRIPASFSGPEGVTNWGFYTAKYDHGSNDGSGTVEQRFMVGSINDAPSGETARRQVNDTNALIIQNYAPVDVISWEQDDVTAIDRITFTWGDGQKASGVSWLTADKQGHLVVATLFGESIDDGMRNGMEKSLTLVPKGA